jgi:hypothetical protein
MNVILSPSEISGERVRLPFGKTDSRVSLSGLSIGLGIIEKQRNSESKAKSEFGIGK